MERKESKTRRTSLAAPAADLDRLRLIAESEQRTLSAELRFLIRRRIDEFEADLKAAA